MTKRRRSQIPQTGGGDDDFLPPTPEQTEYLRRQQDPYAKLSVTARDSGAVSEPRAAAAQYEVSRGLSKKDFDFESRKILGFYVPGVHRGGLPRHYRDFIARNLKRTGLERSRVLKELRKYDLSDIPGVQTRFNREKEELTEAKLRETERAAGIKD